MVGVLLVSLLKSQKGTIKNRHAHFGRLYFEARFSFGQRTIGTHASKRNPYRTHGPMSWRPLQL